MKYLKKLPVAAHASLRADATPHLPIAQLVGRVYDSGAPTERCRLLEHLMSPLGALSLALIADGVFADMRFRHGWQQMHVRVEDAQKVCTRDVIALADHVQQVSSASVEALGQRLAAWPVMSASVAAEALMAGITRCTSRIGFLAPEHDAAVVSPA